MYNDFQYSNSTLFSINNKKKIYQIQIKLCFKLRATPTYNKQKRKKGKWKMENGKATQTKDMKTFSAKRKTFPI